MLGSFSSNQDTLTTQGGNSPIGDISPDLSPPTDSILSTNKLEEWARVRDGDREWRNVTWDLWDTVQTVEKLVGGAERLHWSLSWPLLSDHQPGGTGGGMKGGEGI